MQFLFQPLTWAFFLVLAPLLIHLINLMRQRRVQWAAMEFLLASYKKHRRWVWLRQLLLLLLRMLAIAAIVAMLARLVTRDQWTSFFSGQATHHYVLLDDSFSMADRSGSVEAFDLARQAVTEICKQASKQGTLQKLTLVRYSQADKATETQDQAGAIADINGEIISDSLLQLLDERNKFLSVSDLAVGHQPALEMVEKLIRQETDEKQIIHILSDFRDESWDRPNDTIPILETLQSNNVDIRFVRCAQQEQDNLAIVQLAPVDGTHAAGVPLLMNVTVKNFGTRPADTVQVKIKTMFHPMAADGTETSTSEEEELPSLVIDDLPPGESVTRQVEVYFATAGRHVVHASLVPDAVETDNDRWCVIDLPEGVPTLLVEDAVNQRGSYYLESVFRPGKRTETGIRTTTQPSTFLRDSTVDELTQYEVIYLLRPEKLSGRALENLDAYVRGGGGLAMFLGPETDIDFFNDWYADGSGLFPAELAGVDQLARAEDGSPDLQFDPHPIFSALQGQRNPFASKLRVSDYVKTKGTWSAPEDSGTRVIAKLRNGAPFAIEKRVGAGRVVVFLTTADSEWNNWARGPSFVVVMLQLHGYLAAPATEIASKFVGAPIEFQLDSATFASEVSYRLPSTNGDAGSVIKQTATIIPDSPVLSFSLGQSQNGQGRTGETDLRGVYEIAATTVDGGLAYRRFALNVDNRESDLSIADNAELAKNLESVDFSVFDADEIIYGSVNDQGTSWSDLLLAIVVPLLLLEQVIAYFASYHPKPLVAAGGNA